MAGLAKFQRRPLWPLVAGGRGR